MADRKLVFPSLVPLFPLVAALLGSAVPTPACSWIESFPANIRAKQAGADATVHGVLVKTSAGRVCEGDILRLHFLVRGASGLGAIPGDTVVIGTHPGSAACGVDYALGTEVVVFATKSPQSCRPPVDFLFTTLPSGNVERPSAAQIDSLDFDHPLRTLTPAATAARRGLRPALVNGRLTFAAGAGPDAFRCGADGRSVEGARK